MGDMHYGTFLTFNVIGGALWAVGLTLAGFFLGSLIPDIDKFLLPIVGGIVIVSIAPTAYHILKDAENRKKIRHGFAKAVNSRRKKS